MNLYTDLVSFSLEPKTTVIEAQDWMSLQSNLRCATRRELPSVKLELLGDVQPYFMHRKLLQQQVELQHRRMVRHLPTNAHWHISETKLRRKRLTEGTSCGTTATTLLQEQSH